MDIKRKLELTSQHIESIARHDDVDLAVREAALDKVVAQVEEERAAAKVRVQAKVEAALAAPDPAE